MKSLVISAALLVASLAGCTTPQGLYEAAQQNERFKCNSLPNQSDYQRCMQQNSLDYARYEKERKKAAS